MYSCRKAQNNKSLLTIQNKSPLNLKLCIVYKNYLFPALHTEIFVMCTTSLWNWLVQSTSTSREF
jgi:hypothetical protein